MNRNFLLPAVAAAPAVPSILATIGPPLAAALPVLIPAALVVGVFGLLLHTASEDDKKAKREAAEAEAAEAERQSRIPAADTVDRKVAVHRARG